MYINPISWCPNCDKVLAKDKTTGTPLYQMGKQKTAHVSLPLNQGTFVQNTYQKTNLLDLFLHGLDVGFSGLNLFLQLFDLVIKYKLEFLQLLVLLFQVIDSLFLVLRKYRFQISDS